MPSSEKINLSEEQVAMREDGELVVFPATWENFGNFLVETDYRIDYHDGEIVVTGLATLVHELLVTQLVVLAQRLLSRKIFLCRWQQRGIRMDGRQGHYNANILIIEGNLI